MQHRGYLATARIISTLPYQNGTAFLDWWNAILPVGIVAR
jgi:hypothetical protein